MSRVGFVGLGQMGFAIAERLVDAHRLVAYDADPGRVAELVALGAEAARTPADLGACEYVITCLPTSAIVEDVLFGDGGLAAQLSRGTMVLDCTSGHPETTRELAARLAEQKITFVDAPVSGGPQGARAGTLAIMVGGSPTDFSEAQAVLAPVSPNIRHVGAVGAAHTVKALNNVLAAAHRLIAFEMLGLAVAGGVDPQVFVDTINLSSGRSYATEFTLPRFILGPQLTQGFSLGLASKDVDQACSLIPGALAANSLALVVKAVLHEGLAALGPNADVNELIRLYEEALDQPLARESATT